MLPLGHRATITVGATLFSLHASHGATLGLSFAIRFACREGTHKFQVVAVEDVQGRAVENVQEEVETFHEEVPQGFNVTCSQYFFSVTKSFISGTPSTSLVHNTSFRMGLSITTFSSIKHNNPRTQPCGWEVGPRDTNAQRHTPPLQKNCHRKKAATIQPSKAGMPKAEKRNHKNTTPCIAHGRPAYTKKAKKQEKDAKCILCPKTGNSLFFLF